MPKVHPDKRVSWRMPEPCDNCPFSQSKAGKFLRSTLRPSFVRETEENLLRGGHFLCHKTTRAAGWDEDGNYSIVGPELVCAGAIEWQAERGITADLVQIMERLESIGCKSTTKDG
jgi:hypothetical protein